MHHAAQAHEQERGDQSPPAHRAAISNLALFDIVQQLSLVIREERPAPELSRPLPTARTMLRFARRRALAVQQRSTVRWAGLRLSNVQTLRAARSQGQRGAASKASADAIGDADRNGAAKDGPSGSSSSSSGEAEDDQSGFGGPAWALCKVTACMLVGFTINDKFVSVCEIKGASMQPTLNCADEGQPAGDNGKTCYAVIDRLTASTGLNVSGRLLRTCLFLLSAFLSNLCIFLSLCFE